MMVFSAKKLLLDREITSLELNIFKDQSNAQESSSGSFGVPNLSVLQVNRDIFYGLVNPDLVKDVVLVCFNFIVLDFDIF